MGYLLVSVVAKLEEIAILEPIVERIVNFYVILMAKCYQRQENDAQTQRLHLCLMKDQLNVIDLHEKSWSFYTISISARMHD